MKYLILPLFILLISLSYSCQDNNITTYYSTLDNTIILDVSAREYTTSPLEQAPGTAPFDIINYDHQIELTKGEIDGLQGFLYRWGFPSHYSSFLVP